MKPSDHNEVPIDLISRYLSGEASPDEIIDFEKWRSHSPQNQKIFTQYQNLWERTGQLSLFADIDIENEWKVFLTHIEETKKPRVISLKTALIRTAAALVIGLVLGFSGYYLYNALSFTTVVA
jgi:ferric-dicitrate binding protein FerR (iron transport regulator)